MSTEAEAIRLELSVLCDQAQREGKALWCHYQNLWFTPAELRRENAAGRFLWSAVNWKLRDPAERTQELTADVERAQRELARWTEHVGR